MSAGDPPQGLRWYGPPRGDDVRPCAVVLLRDACEKGFCEDDIWPSFGVVVPAFLFLLLLLLLSSVFWPAGWCRTGVLKGEGGQVKRVCVGESKGPEGRVSWVSCGYETMTWDGLGCTLVLGSVFPYCGRHPEEATNTRLGFPAVTACSCRATQRLATLWSFSNDLCSACCMLHAAACRLAATARPTGVVHTKDAWDCLIHGGLQGETRL